MTPPVIIGIDPGLTGAIACLHADTGALIWVEDMPTIHDPDDGHEVHLSGVVDLLSAEKATLAIVELARAPKGQKANLERQLLNRHLVIGALRLLKIPAKDVLAAQWKRALNIPPPPLSDADGVLTRSQRQRIAKATSRQRACELYPADAWRFARAMDDGRADSVLIARWGWETGR